MITLDRELLDRAYELPYVSDQYSSSEGEDRRAVDQDGFVYLGAGCERTVWLGPDGNVYKCDGRYSGSANVKEYNKYRALCRADDMPTWIYIPETVYDEKTGIVVAEFIEGSQPWTCYYDVCECPGNVCRWERASNAFEYCGSYDGHAGNCVIVEGNSPDDFVVAIIDFTR